MASSPSNGGISSSSSHGQSAPPFCSLIKLGREFWDEWDWATSATTAREFVAVVGVLGLSMLTSVWLSFVISSLVYVMMWEYHGSIKLRLQSEKSFQDHSFYTK